MGKQLNQMWAPLPSMITLMMARLLNSGEIQRQNNITIDALVRRGPEAETEPTVIIRLSSKDD
jgi:CHASE2 domain-containing sensor protein